MRGAALFRAFPDHGTHAIPWLLLAFALALVGGPPMVCYACRAARKINAIPGHESVKFMYEHPPWYIGSGDDAGLHLGLDDAVAHLHA